MIDLHFHILPGLDDGPPDMPSALALAQAAAADGVRSIVATPHVNWEWPNTAQRIGKTARELQGELARRGMQVRIHSGAEIALTRAHEMPDEELHRLRLGGGPYLLIEAPHTHGMMGIEHMLVGLQHRGHQIVLAHVERCPAFIDDEALLARLVAGGMLASVTSASLGGRLGSHAQRAGLRFIAAGLVHNVSSDAHNLRSRPPGILEDLEVAGLSDYADWLARDVPAAILAGAELPEMPEWPPLAVGRGLGSRLLGRG